MKDCLIHDFEDAVFASAFQIYFGELGISVKDWPGLFREMNDGANYAYVRCTDGGETVGFVQFCTLSWESWFFRERCGFVREFWIREECRGQGHGSALLELAESWLADRDVHRILLTTDTAPDFYRKHGYRPAPGITAKNSMEVFEKNLQKTTPGTPGGNSP